MSKRSEPKPQSSPWKLLLWTAIAGLIFGLIGFGEVAEDWLRMFRNGFHKHNASGQIVVVDIDDKALREIGNWPWPRHDDAKLVDALSVAGAKRIAFDINFSFPSDPAEDRAFAESIARSGKVTLFTRFKVGPTQGTQVNSPPLPAFAQHAQIGTTSVAYNWENAVWTLPYALDVNGRNVPSYAALMAGVTGEPGTEFPVDYSIDVRSVPHFSASDILDGRVPSRMLAGKQVIVGVASEVIGDAFFIPGYGRSFGVDVHAIGAETLKSGTPIGIGWIPGLVFGLIAAALAVRFDRNAARYPIIAGALATLFVLPGFLEAHLVFADVTPGLFVVLVVGSVLAWRAFRARGLVNPDSNLANLNALRSNTAGKKKALIAARVLNYEEILSTLPVNSERQLTDQIVNRLSVGAPDRVLYQGDAGIFAWFEEPRAPFGHHLDALYSLFRNPATIAGLPVDLSIAFGVELGSSRSLSNRLASALVAADEAAHDGLKWKYHDPDTVQDASWKLSMLSQLDDAIDKGQVWVAYQPKLELRTRRIIGAEALARWTHPEKGPIAASEFVAAAEQSDRITKLTDFVLETAVGAAASINRRGTPFDIAVNLSARLLSDKGLILRVSALLARHGLAPSRLTLELTETAALTGSGEGLEMIAKLRELGVGISIDDYGTGLSTLEYLKKVPANEIKIDQSFVKGMVENRSDRLMVQSTIGLAHSLGRRVVAEGVEEHPTLDLLLEMECDIVQGYAVGRPMSIESLARRITTERKRGAA
ncbi:EAL domain-containing protein [Sphingomonas sp.]|uniref:EAL domain-containing protein n=1 Tax=Sphingomonas sp. TaxID=28214 RepID=UPI0025E14D48|nr:EAL domain-containing protein [Sphingomonas sp.]MBV9528374.1 EAL domain-containing protein [Sphingomonas sp.]